MHTLEEITEALKVIKEVCYEHNCFCAECPLRKTDNDCSIVDGDDNIAPKDWDFYDPENIKLIL